MAMNGIFREMRRRNVFKVGVAYAIAAWLVAQIISLVQEPLHLPGWFDTAVILLLIVGFPFALILAWAFELTPQGIKRTAEADALAAQSSESGKAESPIDVQASESSEESIAVLPFVDMSPEKDQEYFADGISEELLNQLARIRNLHVAGRTSSFSFKGKNEDLRSIGQKLNVAHVLEGSVRKSGNRVRVTAQLIKAADGYHLWTESYDRDLDDIFAIQDDIARKVTDALSVTLGVGDLGVSTRNVAAYDTFLEGRARYHSSAGTDDWLAAMELLQKSTRLDPDFLEAQVALVNVALGTLNVLPQDRGPEIVRIRDDALGRAMEISPDSPGVLCARGLLAQGVNHLIEAGRLLEEAYRQAPNDSVVVQSWGNFLGEVGRVSEAVVVNRRWASVEPLYVQPSYLVGMSLEMAGDLDAAAEQYRLTGRLQGDPTAFAGPELVVALTRHERPAIEAGLEKVLQNDLGMSGHLPLTAAMRDNLDNPEAALVVLRRTLEDADQLGALMRSVIAVWASWFGDDELALEVFQAIKGMHSTLIWFVIWRPLHRRMRKLPGFKDLLRDIGLVDYWRETGHWGDYVRPVGDDDFECI